MAKKKFVPIADQRRTRRRMERRKGHRLRYLIDELKAGIQKNRNDIDLIFGASFRSRQLWRTFGSPQSSAKSRNAAAWSCSDQRDISTESRQGTSVEHRSENERSGSTTPRTGRKSLTRPVRPSTLAPDEDPSGVEMPPHCNQGIRILVG